MTVPPYAVSYVVTILVSWSADHFNARALHSAAFATIGALGFLCFGWLESAAARGAEYFFGSMAGGMAAGWQGAEREWRGKRV